jgi:hypothetical protein
VREVRFGVLPGVEYDRHLRRARIGPGRRADRLVLGLELADHAGELGDVGPVPRVGVPGQREPAVPGDDQPEPDQPQVRALLLGFAPLRDRRLGVGGGDEGGEVGHVVDWTGSDDQDRRVGLFHGVLNTAALGLQGLSLTARLAGHRGTARGLGAAGLAVTGAAAYLGGHLVFAKAVMVSRVAGADGPRRWVRVVEEAELPDDVPTGVQADGRQILLYRHDGPSMPSTTCAATPAACSAAARLRASR